MKKIYKLIILLSFLMLAGWDTGFVSKVVSKSSHIHNQGERIAYITQQFLGIPYEANTLKGSPDEKEDLVIKLDGMDCFTFLDYVEAMRLSSAPEQFPENLRKVRYFGGEIDYSKRKHFFTDWVSGENNTVKDITSDLPGAVAVEKYINRKSDKNNWLKNVPQTMRMVYYVPGNKIDKNVIKLLQNGDYIGIYSDKDGLDVTHTGIFIRNDKGEFFRNTSSLMKKVADYPFKEYKNELKGIIVLRAK